MRRFTCTQTWDSAKFSERGVQQRSGAEAESSMKREGAVCELAIERWEKHESNFATKHVLRNVSTQTLSRHTHLSLAHTADASGCPSSHVQVNDHDRSAEPHSSLRRTIMPPFKPITYNATSRPDKSHTNPSARVASEYSPTIFHLMVQQRLPMALGKPVLRDVMDCHSLTST